MWKKIYVFIILTGTVLALVNSIIAAINGQNGYAWAYTALIIFGSGIMWLVGKSIFNNREEV